MEKRHIAILGSTGSIGRQALDVIRQHRDLFQVELLTANNSSDLLIQQAIEFDANAVVICNDTTPVHASPDSASKIIRQPSQGVTVRISREHSNWTEVVFADGEMGWISNAHIEAI